MNKLKNTRLKRLKQKCKKCRKGKFVRKNGYNVLICEYCGYVMKEE